jgi:hypothetical protein
MSLSFFVSFLFVCTFVYLSLKEEKKSAKLAVFIRAKIKFHINFFILTVVP